ncbi:enolase C-terminal domain-like protein [Sorangium sp. So ce388]|uniref:enolase C-terminal domain-like protein n=1 Tax=Sorangium sp. So ce388 TaxID=3133309 RepID=UPI003F5C33E8
MEMLAGPEVPLSCVVARRFHARAHFPAIAVAPAALRPEVDTVTGWLVGATDGRSSGWWGPVDMRVALLATELFDAIDDRSPCDPGAWAERARSRTRHAHMGLGAVAIGAAELAIWDLAGQRAQAPVWALVGGVPRCTHVDTYATCFGKGADAAGSPRLAAAVAALGWRIQKWCPPHSEDAGAVVARLAEAAGGTERIAVDMCGRWDPEAAKALCRALPPGLAWIEEPLPPWRLRDVTAFQLTSPLAAGEHCYGPQDTLLLEAVLADIWQPDAVFCGGFASLIEIAAASRRGGRRCLPHGGGFLAAVHAAACDSGITTLEWHLRLEPLRQAHLATPVIPDDNLRVKLPDRPGWAGPLSRGL